MAIKSRIQKLEANRSSHDRFIFVHGERENSTEQMIEEDIQNHCDDHNINRRDVSGFWSGVNGFALFNSGGVNTPCSPLSYETLHSTLEAMLADESYRPKTIAEAKCHFFLTLKYDIDACRAEQVNK